MTLWYAWRGSGHNSMPILPWTKKRDIKDRYKEILAKIEANTDIEELGDNLKREMKHMDRSDFRWFAVSGTMHDRKEVYELSRGTAKLEEIIMQSGIPFARNVLSLCAGRGGWDYLVSQSRNVSRILSVTFGAQPSTPGHEDYSKREWVGKDKITVMLGDVKKLPEDIGDEFQMILFDGGEKREDHATECRDFYDLLVNGCTRYLGKKHSFIIKILTPHSHDVIRELNRVRELTGRGNLILLASSKNSNQELYFVSTKPNGRLHNQVNRLTRARIQRMIAEDEVERTREAVLQKHNAGGIDYSESMKQVGNPIHARHTRNNHWDDVCTFPYGSTSTSRTVRVDYMHDLVKQIRNTIPRYNEWEATSTNVDAAEKIWRKKIDTSPKEKSMYTAAFRRVAMAMATKLLERGHRIRVLSDEELIAQANKQGAGGVQDRDWKNVGEFLTTPGWQNVLARAEDSFRAWKPLWAIFNIIVKKEKKKLGSIKPARYVAYLPIPGRILEMKYLGSWLEMTKPIVNACCVGGLGLHDFGHAVARAFRDAAVCLDIAGFDTRVPASILEIERDFLIRMGACEEIVRPLYEVYMHPRILVTVRDDGQIRTKCYQGLGQRMSGTQVTYAGNTFVTNILAATAYSVMNDLSEDEELEFMGRLLDGNADITILSSGDDHLVSGTRREMRRFARSWKIYNDLGFIRKDIADENDSPIAYSVGEVQFCSHYYELITYRDSGREAKRWMPTRDYNEIFGKAAIWISGSSYGLDQATWGAAQAVNLLLNYHHMRDCRRLAYGIRAILPRNLRFEGKQPYHMDRPWLSSGEILKILNHNLFGPGTHYPDDNGPFELTHVDHLGYMSLSNEVRANPHFFVRKMKAWRDDFANLVYDLSSKYGGDGHLEGMHHRYYT